MPTVVSTKEQPVITALPMQPSILMSMPFEPKLYNAKQLLAQVRVLTKKAEKLLLGIYSGEQARPVIDKMNTVFRNLNFHCFKKSMAAFFSASSHKLFYVDMKLKEEVQLNNSFQIRDLLLLKEQPVEYLVLVLNDLWAKTYFGNEFGFRLIKTDRPIPFSEVKELGSFTIECRKKQVPGSLYKHISNDFSLIAQAYQLPVFVVGSARNVNYFCQIVKNKKDIVQLIYKSTDNINESRILQELRPYFKNWNDIKQRYLRRQLDDTAGKHLEFGIERVTDKCKGGKHRLLMVEEGYLNGEAADRVHMVNSDGEVVPQACNTTAELDNIFQSLLENGGEVELVRDGLLKDYERIVLIDGSTDALFNYQVSSASGGGDMFI